MLTKAELAVWGRTVVFPKVRAAGRVCTNVGAWPGDSGLRLASGYDLVIFDEVNVALFFGLLLAASSWRQCLIGLSVAEVVCTGRNAPDLLFGSG